ncbi:hypothetical protein Esi_0447_0008 [Ectocarpus siliculosus]|uniref:Uncharacterized protein n=1 Tax=Ectocarpus siliculosus TaxID=2880 RepID=D7G1C9_ECTSI|nr:hypothetical protein Esi_0447_0008 [Ectocarpus siliculosus]|eukprot:CBJ33239.1 hypothetical protein Esi_0447_0008 [Ectocarpus siliculosus]
MWTMASLVRRVHAKGASGASRAGRRWWFPRANFTITTDRLTGLIEFPPGFRCIWNDLPHGLQFTILLLMLGILYGVNRLFDKADEAVYTRLACATSGLLNEKRNHHAPRLL